MQISPDQIRIAQDQTAFYCTTVKRQKYTFLRARASNEQAPVAYPGRPSLAPSRASLEKILVEATRPSGNSSRSLRAIDLTKNVSLGVQAQVYNLSLFPLPGALVIGGSSEVPSKAKSQLYYRKGRIGKSTGTKHRAATHIEVLCAKD